MKIIINILVIIGAITFIYAGLTGSIKPFGEFFANTTILRLLEILIGISLIATLRNR